MFLKIRNPTNSVNFTGKRMCLFSCEICSLFIKKRLQHSCFPVKFAKFLKTFFTEHLQWLLLYDAYCCHLIDDPIGKIKFKVKNVTLEN